MSPLVEKYSPVDESLKKVLAAVRPGRKPELIPSQEARGRVLDEDVSAREDVPPFATSHMDGFALASKSVRNASKDNPVALRVVGSSEPGALPKAKIRPGDAFRVATGAGIPGGADAVIPVESVAVGGDAITVTSATEPGSYVFGAGEDIRKGDLLLPRGRTIMPHDVGLLASLKRAKVRVAPMPKVSIIPTGYELTSSTSPAPGKVPESHSVVFLNMCRALGCDAFNLGVVEDDPGTLARTLKKALAHSDLVLTIGGTSAGRHDFVVGTVSRLGPEVLIHGLRLDRGRVTGVASVRGRPVLMLPGPIQAGVNAFLILGVPLIDAISGRDPRRLEVPCNLARGWAARRRFPDFLKVVYVKLKAGDTIEAEPVAAETESMKILADSDGYFVVPPAVERLEPGDRVNVRLFPGDSRFV